MTIGVAATNLCLDMQEKPFGGCVVGHTNGQKHR